MATHITKQDHKDGVELPKHKHITWCGRKTAAFDVAFADVTHAIHAIENQSSWGYPCCMDCLKAIRRLIDAELKPDNGEEMFLQENEIEPPP